MCALLPGVVLDIGLDPVFIYGLDMGVAGAAIATAVFQFVSTLVYLTYVLRKRSAFTFGIKDFRPSEEIYAEVLKIGIPTLTFQLLTSLSIALTNRAANGFSFFLFGFYTVYSSLFLALGKGTAGFILGACRQGICFVPVILLLPIVWGMNGIFYAGPVADVISAIITVFMALHLHKEFDGFNTDAIYTAHRLHFQHKP